MSDLLSVSEALKELTGAVNNLGDRFGKMEVRLEKVEVKLENLDNRLEEVEVKLENLDNRLEEVEVKLENLDNRLEEVEGEVGKLGTKVEGLERGMGRVNQHMGNLVEGQLRFKVAGEYGSDFAKRHTFGGLCDVANYVVFNSEPGSRPCPFEVFDGAQQLACALLDGNIAEDYARALQLAVQASSDADEDLKVLYDALPKPLWYDDYKLDARQISAFLGALPQDQHQPLRLQLGWLRDLLLAPRHEAEEMLIRGSGKGGSLGIVLLQYAATPGKYLPPAPARYQDLKLASDTVECDIKGNIVLFKTKALLNVGEIKSPSDGYSKGVDQLERRLDFLEWSIRHLRDTVTDITRVGHIFMPYNEAFLDNAQGSDDTNTCIHMHFL